MTDLTKSQDWSALDADQLEEAVTLHNRFYWHDNNARISDPDFDKLVEALREKRPQSPVLDAIGPAGAGISETGDAIKVTHDTPMLSLDKCYDEETLLKWFGKFDGVVVASPKVDGVAGSIKYDEEGNLLLAATRGTGVEGELMTENARRIVDLPEKIAQGPLEVRGEAYMPLSTFNEKFAEDYSNPRNLTAGALKQKDPAKTAAYGIHFFAYDLLGVDGITSETDKLRKLGELGFTPVDGVTAKVSELQKVYDAIAADRDAYDYEMDGVVYKADDLEEQERMGHTAHHPRYAIAYKFQGESGQSTLREVHWSVSRTGAINPVGIVDPVTLSGASVTRCSLHNLAIIEKLGGEDGLRLNSRVLMMRRGGVIPHLEKVLEPGDEPVQIPQECPGCGEPTYRDSDVLMADHSDNCRASRIKQVEHFADVMEIKGFGPKLLEQLYDAEFVTEPADFYTVTVSELCELERVGQKLAEKLVQRVAEKRKVPVERFLRSLGIEELGKHVSKILAREKDSLEGIFAMTEEELAAIHTIGEIIAHKVVVGLERNRALIDDLLEHVEVTFPEPIEIEADENDPVAFKSFLFTGALESMSRKEAQDRVRERGGETPSSVKKDLDYLVIGDADLERFNEGWRTNKLKKAETYNDEGSEIAIVGESQFLDMLGESA